MLGLVCILSLLLFRSCLAQTPVKSPGKSQPYTLTVPVNEVSLTFHVSGSHGSPIENLTQDDLRLFDNGKLQKQILSFRFYDNLSIHAGFLFDTSTSMQSDMEHNRAIANYYVTHFLRKGTDQAFVMGFDTQTRVTQDWTDNPEAIASGLRSVVEDPESEQEGTAIFDSLYETCRDRWSTDSHALTGNFILLFTDGIDNASHARIEDVIHTCQRTRTAIYIFTNQWKSRTSRGQEILNELATRSGGRIFLKPAEKQIREDLQIMESDQRSQYRLTYKPSDFKPDGSFHRIKLACSVRRSAILVRSGYYAVGKP